MTRDLAAYGVGFVGLGGPGAPEPPPSWPRWTVVQAVGPAGDAPGLDVWDDHARIGMPGVGEFRLDRAARRIELRVGEPWTPEAVLHPGLAPAAAVVAHWMGRATVHAAAVVIDGRVWGLLGEKGAGKSTIAAHLVGLGCALLTDDLLVADRMEGFAGPGAVDLRADVGLELGGHALGVVGNRERWRAALPIGTLSAPLGGWIQLAWTEEATTCEPVDAPGRLAALDHNTMLPPEGAQLLAMADLPMLRFARRQDASQARTDAARLMEVVTAGE